MKTFLPVKILILVLASAMLFACRSSKHAHHPHGLPPGQAKKIYGHQSARAFAPGQRKKRKVIVVQPAQPKAKAKGKKGKKH